MVAWSKLSVPNIQYNCYDVGHPWTPSCSLATIDVGIKCFYEALKIYTSVYLFTAMVQTLAGKGKGKGKDKDNDKKESKGYAKLQRLVLEILQSTCFLSWNGMSFIGSVCVWRGVLGTFTGNSAGFLPGFVASLMAIFLERKARRRMLTVYVCNVASESIFRMAVARNLVIPVRNGEVLLFSITMSIMMYLYRRKDGDMKDITSKALRYLIGTAELSPSKRELSTETYSTQKPGRFAERPRMVPGFDSLMKLFAKITAVMKQTSKHSSCQHNFGCLYYCLSGFLRPFTIASGARIGLDIILNFRKIILKRRPSLILDCFRKSKNYTFGIFLGSFCGVFMLVSCSLRWLRDGDDQRHALLAGFLAGFAMLAYPAPSLAMYLTWKLIEIVYLRGCEADYLPNVPGGLEVVYAIATAMLLHIAVMEPHNLKPSYWSFLNRLTRHRISEINRNLLDFFGTHSSTIVPGPADIYDHRYTSALCKKHLGFPI